MFKKLNIVETSKSLMDGKTFALFGVCFTFVRQNLPALNPLLNYIKRGLLQTWSFER